jgi:hypothetical protein
MKLLALFAITVSVGSSTIVNLAGDNYLAIIPKTCSDDVEVSTKAVCPPPVISTGPYILKSPSGDCWSIPFIQNNGTLPKIPADWKTCPQ